MVCNPADVIITIVIAVTVMIAVVIAIMVAITVGAAVLDFVAFAVLILVSALPMSLRQRRACYQRYSQHGNNGHPDSFGHGPSRLLFSILKAPPETASNESPANGLRP
jgi:hypothetical protein